MKKLNLVPVTIIMIAVFTSLSVLTYAQPFRHGGGNGEGGCQMLDLTEEQESKIEVLKTAQMQEMTSSHNQIKLKEAELTILQTAKTVDMKAVEAKIREIGDIKVGMQVKRATMQNEVRNILTEEQRVKFDMHHANRPMGHHGQMGQMQGKHSKHGKKGNCNGQGNGRKGNGNGDGNGRGNR